MFLKSKLMLERKITMKKMVLLIMSLIVLFCSVSCKDNGTLIGDGGESPTDEYVDNYLYTMIGSTLYRISPYSASVVPVCPDPLCFHNDSEFAGQTVPQSFPRQITVHFVGG